MTVKQQFIFGFHCIIQGVLSYYYSQPPFLQINEENQEKINNAICGIYLSLSLIKLQQESNHEYKQYNGVSDTDTSLTLFPLPEIFIVLTFSSMLMVQFSIKREKEFSQEPNQYIELEEISVHTVTEKSLNEDKDNDFLVQQISKFYDGLAIAILDNLSLFIFIIIQLIAHLNTKNKNQFRNQQIISLAGFIVGNFLLLVHLKFIGLSIISGYILYYACVLILKVELEISRNKNKLFLIIASAVALSSTVFYHF